MNLASRMISLVVVVILAVWTPLMIQSTSDDSIAKRQAFNTTCDFLDEVVDSRTLTSEMLSDYSRRVTAYGIPITFQVSREIRSVDAGASEGKYDVHYVDAGVLNVTPDNPVEFQTGDRVTLEVQSRGNSMASSLLRGMTGTGGTGFRFRLAARVR